MGEDKVARFDLIVGRTPRRQICRPGRSETPTARCGVLFCGLDHKLNVCWDARYKGLAKDLTVTRGQGVLSAIGAVTLLPFGSVADRQPLSPQYSRL
jgi:hypothetical protein